MRHPVMTQYNVELPNTPGLQAKISRLLMSRSIGAKSMVTTRVGARTRIQFLAPKNNALRDQLMKINVAVREDPVFQLEMPHHHYELHKLVKSLAELDINILSLYSMVEGEHMRIVLAVDQPANAVALVEKLGYNPDYSVYD